MNDNNNNHNNNDRHEHKKKGLPQQYNEFINFAIQGMIENAQFAIVIAVGIFGILAIFATLNEHAENDFWKNVK
jgi:nucleoside permease NupC